MMIFQTNKLLFIFFLSVSFMLLSSSIPDDDHSILGFTSEEEEFGLFQLWEKENDREYQNTREEAKRFKIFQKNLKYIRETNAKRKRKSPYDYRLGLNKFADMSPEEFSSIYLHPLGTVTDVSANSMELKDDGSCQNIPPALDWSKRGVVTGIKNQKRCGSCWAFSATGAMEGINAIATGKLVSLSEQELVDCDKKSKGCNGGWYFNAFQWVINNGGIRTEADYPYVAQDGVCKARQTDNNAVTIEGYTNVSMSDEALLCATAQQPISVALDARDFQFYQGGIYDGGNCSSPYKLNHAVLVVGYDSLGGEDYWIVKNSWGIDWGERGYIWIRRNTGSVIGVCAINAFASYPTKGNSATRSHTSLAMEVEQNMHYSSV